jgi:hypothetical protein
LANDLAFANLETDIKENYRNDLQVAVLAVKYFNCPSTMEAVCKKKTGPEISCQVTNLYDQPFIPHRITPRIYSGGPDVRRTDWSAYYLIAGLKASVGINL